MQRIVGDRNVGGVGLSGTRRDELEGYRRRIAAADLERALVDDGGDVGEHIQTDRLAQAIVRVDGMIARIGQIIGWQDFRIIRVLGALDGPDSVRRPLADFQLVISGRNLRGCVEPWHGAEGVHPGRGIGDQLAPFREADDDVVDVEPCEIVVLPASVIVFGVQIYAVVHVRRRLVHRQVEVIARVEVEFQHDVLLAGKRAQVDDGLPPPARITNQLSAAFCGNGTFLRLAVPIVVGRHDRPCLRGVIRGLAVGRNAYAAPCRRWSSRGPCPGSS